MKTIKLTHKQAMDVVDCLDTLHSMEGTFDDEFNAECKNAGKISKIIENQLLKLGYIKPKYEKIDPVNI